MNNIAIRANNPKGILNEITFKNNTHKVFYTETILKCKNNDSYHKALIYCLG